MDGVKIFWDPVGFELEYLGKKSYLGASDGDTPIISIPIRMLSIDTPEVHYPGNQKPSSWDNELAQLAVWIQEGRVPVNSGLGQYLYGKLASGTVGTLQEDQGKKAALKFQELLETKLTKPNGKKRKIYLRAADEAFDNYGRLLAYIAPCYTNKELKSKSRIERATFNLQMVQSGWAASFPIYPSIPRHEDLFRLQEAAKEAFDNKRGAWADSMMLTGYEFRMCVKLYKVTNKLVQGKRVSKSERDGWVTRFCVDMTKREIFYPQNYYKVPPYNRIFIWPKDAVEAIGRLNLLPSE